MHTTLHAGCRPEPLLLVLASLCLSVAAASEVFEQSETSLLQTIIQVSPPGAVEESGSVVADLLKEAGYSAEQLKEAGYSAEQLGEAGYSTEQIMKAGYSAGQLKEAGYSAKGAFVRALEKGAQGSAGTKVLLAVTACIACLEAGYFMRRIEDGDPSKAQKNERHFLIQNFDAFVGKIVGNGRADPQAQKRGMSWSTYVVVYIGFSIMSSLCTDQYLPQMPLMAKDFQTSKEAMGLTLQVNWVLKAISALTLGPLTDRVGRKPLVIVSGTFMGLSSLACSMSSSLMWFVFARAIQGVSEGTDIAFMCLVRDLYPNLKDRMRFGATLGFVIGIVPVVAPSVGGYIAEFSGSWRTSFALLGLVAFCLTALASVSCQESLQGRKEYRSVIADAKIVLGDRHLMCLLSVMVIGAVSSMLDTSVKVFVWEEDYHKTAFFFTTVNMINAPFGTFGMALAGVCSVFEPVNVLRGCWILQCCLAAFQITIATVYLDALKANIWYLIAPSLVGTVIGVPQGSAAGPLYMEKAPDNAGMAAGIQTCFTNVLGSVLSHPLSYLVLPFGAQGMMLSSASLTILAATTFWVGFGLNPPDWAWQKKKEKDAWKKP